MTVQDRPGRGGGLMMWLGHYDSIVLWGAITVFIIYDILGQPAGLGQDSFVTIVAVVWIISMYAHVRVHEHRLCERCIADTPLDPAAAVRRWDQALKWHHRRVVNLVLLLGVIAILFLDVQHTGHHLPWWGYVLHAVAFLILGLKEIPEIQHRRLYPWCPYCHWDDGGDEEISPDVPAPAMSR